ncbi:MAG TPA: phosphate ABC transporter substrate-binding protein [Pseudomonadales bacterium]
MKSVIKLLLPLVLIAAGMELAQAGIAVVVNADNPTDMLSKESAARLFLKKDTSFKTGLKAEPIDHSNESQLRKKFYTEVANKNPSQMISYWSRMIFTGKAAPPRSVGNDDEEVINAIMNNSGAIGYIDTRSVDKRVKVLLTVN